MACSTALSHGRAGDLSVIARDHPLFTGSRLATSLLLVEVAAGERLMASVGSRARREPSIGERPRAGSWRA